MSKGPGSLVEGLNICPLMNDHENEEKIREDTNEGKENNNNSIIISTPKKVKSVIEEVNKHNNKSPRARRSKTQGDLVKDLIVIDDQPKEVRRKRNTKQRNKDKATASRLNLEDTDSSSSSIIYIDKDEDDDYSPPNSDNDESSISKGSIQSNNDESSNMMGLEDDEDDDDDDDQIVTKSKIGFVNDDFLDSDDTEHTPTNRKKKRKSPTKKENEHTNKTTNLSDSDDDIPKRRKLTRYSRDALNRVPQLASTTSKPTSSEYYSNSEESYNEKSDNEIDTDDQENEDKTLTSSRTSKYYPINCPSTEDEITLQPFRANKPHVCYLAPDGKTRHCYHLNTLYRAAIMTGLKRYDERGKMQLLQPPHFSQIMCDDVMDQIATRFGRQALNIEDSKVYKKIVIKGIQLSRRSGSFGDDNEDDEYNYVNFEQRLNSYFQDLMSSRGDLYCCPLCYTKAHDRYENKLEESGSDSDSDAEKSLPDYYHDPMELLGDLDDKKYKIAATFCFRRVTQVKKHLKVKHNLVISNIDGNDLYRRFQIRATDGLLQRYLLQEKDHYRKELFDNGTVMRSYWAGGHSQTYISLIAHVDELGDRSDDENIDPLVSISSRRKELSLWDQIHAPFAVDNTEVLDDFITDENAEVEYFSGGDASKEEENEPVKENPMEKMISELKKRRRKQRGSNSSSSSSSMSSSSSSNNKSLDNSSIDENEFDSDGDNSKEESGDDSSSEDELVFSTQVKRRKMTPKERILSQRKEIMQANSDDDEHGILSPPNTQPDTTDDFIELEDSE